MGNIESGPEGSLGAVGSLKHRLQSLEETIRSIEVGAITPQDLRRDLLLDKSSTCSVSHPLEYLCLASHVDANRRHTLPTDRNLARRISSAGGGCLQKQPPNQIGRVDFQI